MLDEMVDSISIVSRHFIPYKILIETENMSDDFENRDIGKVITINSI